MPDDFTTPATADIRHGYARHNAQNGPSWAHDETYQRDLRQFDRWLARQLELAVQGERARNAKDRPATREISDVEASAMRLIAALVRSYGEPTEGGTQMHVWDDALGDGPAPWVTITPDPIRHRTVIRVSE